MVSGGFPLVAFYHFSNNDKKVLQNSETLKCGNSQVCMNASQYTKLKGVYKVFFSYLEKCHKMKRRGYFSDTSWKKIKTRFTEIKSSTQTFKKGSWSVITCHISWKTFQEQIFSAGPGSALYSSSRQLRTESV